MWCCDEAIPSVAAGIDDGIIGVPDAMAELVLSEELPDIFYGVEFRGVGWQRQERNVFRHDETASALVPSGTVENDDGMRVRADAFGDFGEMQAHGFGIDPGQYQGCSRTPVGADGAKQVG